jgi:thiamine biosynthesis protein ThiI
MKFVVKYFSEIAIKSKPVRRRFVTMLYCGKGVMSRLHASHLLSTADMDVKVYAP